MGKATPASMELRETYLVKKSTNKNTPTQLAATIG